MLGLHRFLASPIAIELSIISNFLINNHWTFADREMVGSRRVRGLKFNAVSLLSLAVSYGTFLLLSLLVPLVPPVWLQGVAIVPAALVNYFLNSYWTFRDSGSARCRAATRRLPAGWIGHGGSRARTPGRRGGAVPAGDRQLPAGGPVGDFIWDDLPMIGTLDAIRAGCGRSGSLRPRSTRRATTGRWSIPLFWLQHKLWGFAPAGFHAVNVLLHAANTLLLCQLMRRLKVPGAWLVAAVFAVHPVHVESVAWVIELKDVLSGLFYLSALLAWIRFDAEPRQGAT